MKIIKEIKEDDMISEFLRGEINSNRFGKIIIENLKKDKKSRKIITNPDPNNEKDNTYRKKLLGKVRYFEKNKRLFKNFPKNMVWKKAIFTKKDLEKVKFINHKYWNDISNKSRIPTVAAKNINENIKTYRTGNDMFFKILLKIENKNETLPTMIFVAKNKISKIIVLEGHARLTSYFLKPKNIPNKMEVIIGFSEKIKNWNLY